MKLGDLDIRFVSGGKLWIDGGNMFGVVPKVLWQRKSKPDERNRILLETNCLLVRGPAGLVLVDTGYGSKCSPRTRDNYLLEDGDPLVENLADLGVKPNDIDAVVLTHLHFDHVGGCTVRDDAGRLCPTFPNARHYVQRVEWEDATSGRPELAGAYFPDEFVVIEQSGLLELIDGDIEIFPGLRSCVCDGHTRGQQILYLGTGEEQAVYLADLCPSAGHLRAMWTMAYDQHPLHTRLQKPQVLGEAADRAWPVLFEHDPNLHAARLARDERHEFVIAAEVEV